jgi:hypothetical protein
MAEVDELTHVNSSLAPLHLRYERLGVTEPAGQGTLGHANRRSSALEQLKKSLVVGLVSGACHMLASDWLRTLESDFE